MLLLPACPVTDDYFITKGDPNSGGLATGGAYTVSSAGHGDVSSAGHGGVSSAAAPAGAGGDDGSGTAGCVSATSQGHQYTLCFTPLNQADARGNCASLGMTLAVIDDQAENAWIASNFSRLYTGDSPHAFIGANDVAAEGEWRRADGVTFWRGGADGAAVEGNYANWDAGQPSDPVTTAGSEDCLTIGLPNGAWDDMSCDTELPYVCEPR